MEPQHIAQHENSALQRARESLQTRSAPPLEHAPTPDSQAERELLADFADAFERGEMERLLSLLTDDAWVTMPPEPYEYQGPTAIRAFLRGREVARGAMRLVRTRANGQPAFACYLPSPQTDIARPYALFVLTLEGDRISAITWFADSSVFPQFGLPRMLR